LTCATSPRTASSSFWKSACCFSIRRSARQLAAVKLVFFLPRLEGDGEGLAVVLLEREHRGLGRILLDQLLRDDELRWCHGLRRGGRRDLRAQGLQLGAQARRRRSTGDR
jgi:hypothetical protein